MATRNDVTGDEIKSKLPTRNFLKNFDNIKITMWYHDCEEIKARLSVKKGQECNYCAKKEEDFINRN